MNLKIHQIIWALIAFILGVMLIYSIRVYLRDLNKIQAATQRANCQIELTKQGKEEFTICQDIINSTPRENSFF